MNAHAAGTYTVTNLNDSGLGSLRTAIGNANAAPGSTVNFQVGLSGIIPLQSLLPDIATFVTIQGPGSGVIAIDGGHSSSNPGGYRIFHITFQGLLASQCVTISGLTIQNGNGTQETNGGGGGIDNAGGGALVITNCVLRGNAAGNGTYVVNGGAVANYGILTMTNCVISGNNASAGGGALWEWGKNNTATCMATLTNCTITSNTAQNGGAIYANSYSRVVLTNDILYGDGATANSNEISNNSSSPINSIPAVTGTYCDVQGGIDLNDTTNHVLGADPLFVRIPNLSSTPSSPPDYGDLHLRPLSPCIGVGTSNAPAYSPLDLDGNPRSNPPNIGAYEAHAFEIGISVGGDNLTRMLWDNPNGSAYLRRINADGSVTTATYGPYSDSNGVWRATAVATGPNNVTRILWNHPDGRAVLWFVNPNGSFGDKGAYGPYTDGGGTWRATAISVGPDNVAHILWHSPDGRATLWFVNPDGTNGTSVAYGPYNDSGGMWQAVALATGPNGVSRILWHSPDGRATLWYVNPDGTYGTSPAYGPYTDGDGIWQAVADSVGPDNVAHILWHSPDGRATFWFVNLDGTNGTSVAYGPYNDGGGPWQATALATGPNGVSHIQWSHLDGRATLWFVNSNGTYGASGTYGPYMN